MSGDLAILYQVQQLDSEAARLRETLAALDSGEDLEAEVAAAESELAALLGRHRSTEKESLDCELELKTLEEKKAKFQGQLYSGAIRNPRQLSDLQGEVEMLAREIGKVEDRSLELMDSLERERSEIRDREAQVGGMRERLVSVRTKYEGAGARLRAEIGELEQRRGEMAAQVPPQLLKRYEQIRARQGNLGLVKVTADTCPGCRIALPSETLKALKAGTRLSTCENCGRLLFWDGSD